MKILAISHSCVTEVNQQIYVSLARSFGAEISLIVPSNWKNEYTGQTVTPKFLPTATFQAHCLPVAVPGHNSLHFYLKGLSAVIRSANPDVVFLDEEPWSLAALQTASICQRLKKPLVCYTKQNIYKEYPFPFRLIEQKIYQSAAAIVALSEEVRAVLRRKGFSGACPLLAHACDLELFHEGYAKELRQKLRLEGTVVGFMGRFVPEKGLATLIEALSILAGKTSNTKITALLVGAGPEETLLKQAASLFDKDITVVFAGSVPHLEAANYMRCMDLFVIPSRTTPSWKEQFGRVIIEAMACGIPVIGSNSGHIPALIAETGGGLVFQEGNAEDLAQTLSCLVEDPARRASLGATGQAAVSNHFTYDAVAKQLGEILKEAAKS